MTIEPLSSILWKLGISAILILINAFFVAAEFALVSVRRTRVQELVAEGNATARLVQKAIGELTRYIAGTQIGVTLTSLGLGWIGEPAAAGLLEQTFRWLPREAVGPVAFTIALVVGFIVITCVQVVLAELVPKSVALQRTEQSAMFVARPMTVFVGLFSPLITMLSALANRIVLAFGLQPRGDLDSVHSVEELQTLVQQSHAAGVLDDLERQMLQRTFQFGELTAADIMIPRTDIEAIDVNLPPAEMRARLLAVSHSRLPVYDDTLDNIIGVIHVRQLLPICAENRPIDLRALAREPLIVPESVHLDNLLQQIQSGRRHLALIIDEYGGTAGLVTAEDIVEEVFGDFMDLRDATQKDMQKVGDNEYLVRGIMHLHELEEVLGWELEETDASTVGGYVLARLGRAAQVGDVVETTYGSLKVEKMTRYRITQVRLVHAPKPPA